MSPPDDSLYFNFDTIAVVALFKSQTALQKQAISFSELSLKEIESQNVTSIKDVAVTSPNFYQPKYGSRVTSSIYVRGFGSRIDQPSLGVNVDDVPIMNKNSYDFEFFDIRKVEILRGPQGTLYGRNSNGGVMNIYTLSPLSWQGVRASLEINSEPAYRMKVSLYQRPTDTFGYSVATIIGQNQGFFTNDYTDKKIDDGKNAAVRAKLRWQKNYRNFVENTASFGYVQEGGYAYRLFDDTTEKLSAINYNDDCSYERITFTDGLVVKHFFDNVLFSSVTSYQFLDDDLLLDNDFTNLSYFTLNQIQREHTVTQEFVLKQKDFEKKWQWTTGFFAFGKMQDLSAPVTFKKDGIEQLILLNANNGIHQAFPKNNIEFEETQFPVNSDFDVKSFGAALYHESNFSVNHWMFTVGLRAEFEHASMDYVSSIELHYLFNLTMTNYKRLSSTFSGNEALNSLVILPKISAQYAINGNASAYATISTGHKAGGFNTQIFSDIMQNVLMNDMMSDLGMKLNSAASKYSSAEFVTYKPETNINIELGYHFAKQNMQLNCTAFGIQGINQQITIMPEGNGTGRMMSNAGKARSLGIECSGMYDWNHWTFAVNYGCANAKYTDYQYNDTINYKGNFIPYAPQNTISTTISYQLPIGKKFFENITFSAQYCGVGKIYWNDENTLEQSLYSLWSGTITANCKILSFSIFCKNITNAEYHTFYFKSVSRSFYADGTPRLIGLKTTLNI